MISKERKERKPAKERKERNMTILLCPKIVSIP